MAVVIGVDGAGRTHRLRELAADAGDVVWIGSPAGSTVDLISRLEAIRASGSLVVVDDAHRLGGDELRSLAAAAGSGVPMVISRRPTIDRPELAALDEVAAELGGVEVLEPLGADVAAGLVERITGHHPSTDRVESILAAAAGLPVIVAHVAAVPPGTVSPALAARVQRRLAVAGPAITRVSRVMALRLDLPDDVLADAAGIPPAELATAMRRLRDEGMLVPGADEMIPAVADAVLADVSPTERRRVHEAIARALLAAGADPLVTAVQLRAAGAMVPMAADVYRMAGERLRFEDPRAALEWFDEAARAGGEAASMAAGRAEAAALLGRPVDLGAQPSAEADAVRLVLVAGALEAHGGRSGRAAETLLSGGVVGAVIAVPALVATGRLSEAREVVRQSPAPSALCRFAEAALAAVDPAAAVPLFIEAAEAVEYQGSPIVLPDTPHALGALVAVTAGDASTAEHLIERALVSGVGGPVATERHRLLRSWVRMRAGRYDAALAETRRPASRVMTDRDRILWAAVTAGIARRSGDIATLRDSWALAEPALARREVDLFHIEVVEELLVAAARLGQMHRAVPLLVAAGGIVERLGGPASWSAAVGWALLQMSVAADDLNEVGAAAQRLQAIERAGAGGTGARTRALAAAAGCWVQILDGDVRHDAVLAAADALTVAELPWEGSRLAGQAAIRTSDPAVARRLLERARSVVLADPAGDSPKSGTDLLSAREVEIGRLVLDGRTHREIGAQLYISPKTVEHHVARIRTKLGAGTRAEFVATLREVLDRNVEDSGI
jgi:DNA-binding CsgD family transcriptional regulator